MYLKNNENSADNLPWRLSYKNNISDLVVDIFYGRQRKFKKIEKLNPNDAFTQG